MKTTFEDFEKTTLHLNLLVEYEMNTGYYPTAEGRTKSKENFRLAIKTAFLVGHQLGLDEARAILNGEKE